MKHDPRELWLLFVGLVLLLVVLATSAGPLDRVAVDWYFSDGVKIESVAR